MHKKLYTLYQEQNRIFLSFIGDELLKRVETGEPDIAIDSWLNPVKIKELIDIIDINKLEKLSPQELKELDNFLNTKGLLWAYISGNLPLDIIGKIINNFSSIYISMENENINIDNLDEIIKKAKSSNKELRKKLFYFLLFSSK